jgi:hypothetical protein
LDFAVGIGPALCAGVPSRDLGGARSESLPPDGADPDAGPATNISSYGGASSSTDGDADFYTYGHTDHRSGRGPYRDGGAYRHAHRDGDRHALCDGDGDCHIYPVTYPFGDPGGDRRGAFPGAIAYLR